ncbi:hypothetical protein [Burkholderia alba]|uniref:hypothetical protein n=1 Tax=Burkholderia alba TaxID=2683677 RepID=UPI002B05DE5E|nr:hypothetical protein [Burkholderia alba]
MTSKLTDEQRSLINRAANICQVAEYRDTANQLRALLTSRPEPRAGDWLQSGGLLYRLTDNQVPTNRDEIKVTVAEGSRDDRALACRAAEIREWLNGEPRAEVTDDKQGKTNALVPIDPTPAMLDRAVAFALNVKIGGEYRWTNYMVDLWSSFLADAPQLDVRERLTDEQRKAIQNAIDWCYAMAFEADEQALRTLLATRT